MTVEVRMKATAVRASLALCLWGLAATNVAVEKAYAGDPAAPGTAAALLPRAELDALLDRVENDLRSLGSLQVTFTQEKHLAIFTEPVKATGLLLFRRPGDIRFEIAEPFQSVLIARDRTVAKYEFVDRKWMKLNSGMGDAILLVTDNLALWLQGRLREASSAYDVAATNEPEPTVILTPAQTKLKDFIARIELKLAYAPTRVVSLTIREPNGDFTTVVFFNEQRNPQFPVAYFDPALSEPVHIPDANADTGPPATK